MNPHVLSQSFYSGSCVEVAKLLLGKKLVRRLTSGKVVSGIIVETECYRGIDDLASHGKVKETPRNKIMWGKPGYAYVYFIYGMYFMLNIVTEEEGTPAAVLIRSVEPLEGIEEMQKLRGGAPLAALTNGPGKLAQAFSITKELNGVSMTIEETGLWVEEGDTNQKLKIESGPRVGLGKGVLEPWFSKPWRFWVKNNSYVSLHKGSSIILE